MTMQSPQPIAAEHRCPCCMQPVAAPTRLDLAFREVSPIMARVIRAVIRRPGMSGLQLADAVYGGDPNGGPDHGILTLRVTICRENKKLRRLGMNVGTRAMGARSGYYLMEAPHA